MMNVCRFVAIGLIVGLLGAWNDAAGREAPPAAAAPAETLTGIMAAELDRAMKSLGKEGQSNQPPPYFISYDAHDVSGLSILAQQGAILTSVESHRRSADITVRVGDTKLDNTHGSRRNSAMHSIVLPLTDDRGAVFRSLWWGTSTGYGDALQSYLKAKTETGVRAEEEDKSSDFSHQDAVHGESEPVAPIALDRGAWEQRVRALSAIFKAHPQIATNFVGFNVSQENNSFVSSEGTRLVYGHRLMRLLVVASTRADDGMDLALIRTFEGESQQDLPSQQDLERQVGELAAQLEKLRTAPPAEPFNGPALLSGRAAAVYFHEVLGHRLEGQRQRGNQEGETFTKDVGKPILPQFLSVSDDPTLRQFGKITLSGYYAYDDEGQPARKVDLIQDGVLEQFLMSRMPIENFATSNGHGRAQDGRMPTGRQGNLIVTSSKTVSDQTLRRVLIDEIKKQNKPYGLYFEDIASGYTLTQRVLPQAFQVIPMVVYRVYADGRPDELVRGVSIVGTPQAALMRIVATGDKQDVFNGECGAESGCIPVSAIAPAMVFSEIETQKSAQGNSRPPILPPPGAEAGNPEVK